jgi:hypothetical protein
MAAPFREAELARVAKYGKIIHFRQPTDPIAMTASGSDGPPC